MIFSGQSQCPPLRISMSMDVNTYGKHDGLFISTGILTGTLSNLDSRQDTACPLWLMNMSNKLNHPGLMNGHESPLTCQNDDLHSYTSSTLLNANVKNQMHHLNMNSLDNNQPGGTKQNETPIKLNLFDESANVKLVPLHSLRKNLSTQSDNLSLSTALRNVSLICDSTTTTTTLEVFRPKAEGVDFFQLNRGPLSHEREPALIVPNKGPEHEKSEKSETCFSEKIRRVQTAPQNSTSMQKSVQWGESIPIQLSPSPSNSSLALSPASPLIQLPYSPLQQTSGSANLDDLPLSSSLPCSEKPLITSPYSEISPSPDHLTILRRQHREHCERTLVSVPYAQQPPRPPKQHYQGENLVPPRPPKPKNLTRKRSQSVCQTNRDSIARATIIDELKQNGRMHQRVVDDAFNFAAGPVRSASSNEIFRLYQTRDCLGRLVCEW